jgi:ABC-type multidrug transport system fused ATPase/permease subunit
MIDNCSDPITNFTLSKSIDFSNVSFKYPTAAPEQRNVLNNVSFSIKAGESTAIVGPSGSGKSTIV